MTQQHPLILPPNVLQQLRNKAPAFGWHRDAWIAQQAAQWGADQELEACCEWIADWYGHGCNEVIGNLRTSRRPKPPSLKEKLAEALYNEDIGTSLRLVRQLDD